MIHYHGCDGIKPSILVDAMKARHFIISYAMPRRLPTVAEISQSFVLDNGAFSFWRGGKNTDWNGYYEWVDRWHKHPGFDWALIPDIINGEMKENQELIDAWPFSKSMGVPVWHLSESIKFLHTLCDKFPRISFGSSGEYSKVGSLKWWGRMVKAMNSITDDNGRPPCKLHGLRMLNPKIFKCFPFASADSTNVSRSHALDNNWTGAYQPPDNNTRALVIANRIESHQSAPTWTRKPEQLSMF